MAAFTVDGAFSVFSVDDIDAAVAELNDRGVNTKIYSDEQFPLRRAGNRAR